MEIAAIVISGISLIVAIVSFIASIKSQHLQNRVNTLEYKLKQYELEEKEQEKKKNPCIEARINHISKDRYKIKVWNSGNTVAKNVMASWEEQDCMIFYDLEKMPFESLEPQKGFELSATIFFGAPRKLFITTTWENEEGEKQSKSQWCDI